ncbi:tetratricopeptide repeat protein [Muriicola soli]|uniref:Tetratricopeptide repeat protein n=1 Tax=Muriicola soli TaxID=2507538 RepID=A0A411EA21_9FLAO|nr:tetratricopeptide repeat protein [Muriicola soli]QBA64575.1 tetratricopeptide repeat protein [Muriicola soli]
MATYKKRGYKPQNKEEEKALREQGSTTAEVFSALDESASKSEQWVARNQNYILGVIGVIAVTVLGYLGYNQFVQMPKNASAANEMLYPNRYFNEALQNTAERDSLFLLALNGAEGKYGYLDIIDEYSGTPSANIATYAAGMAYKELQQYDKAIEYLEQVSPDEEITASLTLGSIGDSFLQLGQTADALTYYEKAFAEDNNNLTTPRFLYKAGVAALELDQKEKALGYFQRVKDDFPDSTEAQTIDVFIGMAQTQ